MFDDSPALNSHDSWSPLQEIWLGDVYPSSWYDHLESGVRDVFHELTEITQQDLNIIESTLESFGVLVQRPYYDCITDFLDDREHLVKPEICPRDNFVVIGNTLFYQSGHLPAWYRVLESYEKDPRCSVLPASSPCVNGANVVRVGRDIIIDRDVISYSYNNEWPDYRVQVVANGGHLDGCFAIIKPGLILANHYFEDYDRIFPGWEVIRLDDPWYQAAPHTGNRQNYPIYNGKFWDAGIATNRTFNQHIIDHALDWVGCYTETYFELNCLVVDQKNVIMLEKNDRLAETLDRHGVRVHWVPLRTRGFWDGAVHCLTLDVRRQSSIIDYIRSDAQR